MALNIKDARADAIARRLVALTGERITDAVRISLEQRLKREERRRDPRRRERLREIVERYAVQPVVDPREPDEILGYDENGLPT